jgi:hypothetical protein
VTALNTLVIVIEHASVKVLGDYVELIVALMQQQMDATHYTIRHAACLVQTAIFEWIFAHKFDCPWITWVTPVMCKWIQMLAGEDDTALVASVLEAFNSLLQRVPYQVAFAEPAIQAAFGASIAGVLDDKIVLLEFDEEDRADPDLIANTYAALLEPLLELIVTFAHCAGAQLFGAHYWPTLGPLLARAQLTHATGDGEGKAELAACFTACTQNLATVK